MNKTREQMNIVVVGHVDHGKSTVIGRLLADTGSLPQGKLEQVRAQCEQNARPFEYAFLLDALKDEQAQGITIDTARCFFKTEKRDYIIIDAPGHVEFLKNMVSGAARAEAALLVIDAHEGIAENSKRHGYLVSMLGIRQIVVLVNKMDLIDFDNETYNSLVEEYRQFLECLGVTPVAFVPVCARDGDNLAIPSEKMSWYKGVPVLPLIDNLHKKAGTDNKPFRFPVQDVYKFTEQDDDRRIIAGTVESGTVSVWDRVVFLPSGKQSVITSVEGFNSPQKHHVTSGYSAGFTLKDELYVKRGEIMCRLDQPHPVVSSRFRANVFWMGTAPLVPDKKYKLKIATAKVPVRLVEVVSCIDATQLTSVAGKQQVDRHDVAECIFETVKPITFDPAGENETTGRFVIVDNFDIAGGGIIIASAPLGEKWFDRHVRSREAVWEKSRIDASAREARNGHKGKSIVICGDDRRKQIAHELESALFSAHYQCYYCGIENVRAGLDADLSDSEDFSFERIHHLGELSRILTDAGLIVISTIDSIDENDLSTLRKLNAPYEMIVVGAGINAMFSGIDRSFDTSDSLKECVDGIMEILRSRNVIPDYSI
jgi:bifunctional enzyme CysN/CysC